MRALFIAIVALVFLPASAAAQPSCAGSATGTAVAAFAPLDQGMRDLMQKYSLPGGSLAVSYNGRLVFARGYGCANVESGAPVQPDSLFRVASVSKTFTAVAVLLLVQQGKLSLDAPVFGSILTGYKTLPGQSVNPDLLKITVRHLLEHTGGWDRSTTQRFNGVPYREPIDGLVTAAAQALGHAPPSTDADVIGVMLSQPLQHTPGTYYAYSNFGYMLLGRVIEQVSGTTYEQFVQQNILKPFGIGRQKLAATLQSDVANGEVTYYDSPGAPLVKSIFPDVPDPVPAPYGVHFMEDVDAAGAWVTTTVDLTRFLNAIDGRGVPALLNPQTIALMETDPKVQNEPTNSFYGLGFVFQQTGAGLRWTKDGGLPGTSSYVVHSAAGYTWAVVFNSSPSTDSSITSSEDTGGSPIAEISGKIETILGQVNGAGAIPKNDLYSTFKSTLLAPSITAIVNGASFQNGIVPGSWITISGDNLATATRIWWANEVVPPALPVEIDHVRVTIRGKDAAVYYVSPHQLNVQAPTGLLTGPVPVQVIRDGAPSPVTNITYSPAAPAFFMYQSNGKNYADAVHVSGAYVGNVPGTVPAKAGETIELFATGLGLTEGGIVPPVTPLSPLPVIIIGGVRATVSFTGLIYPGEWQINLTVPQVPAGDQPIVISWGGATGAVPTLLSISN